MARCGDGTHGLRRRASQRRDHSRRTGYNGVCCRIQWICGAEGAWADDSRLLSATSPISSSRGGFGSNQSWAKLPLSASQQRYDAACICPSLTSSQLRCLALRRGAGLHLGPRALAMASGFGRRPRTQGRSFFGQPASTAAQFRSRVARPIDQPRWAWSVRAPWLLARRR